MSPRLAIISAGLQSTVATAIADIGGVTCSDLNGRRVIIRLRELGVEVVYTEQVDQWGQMANCCVYGETGKRCSFCRCDRRNVK